MKKTMRTDTVRNRRDRQSGNVFFMLMASIALIGAMTVGAGNIVKGIVTSMSDVTRKTITEEKMQGAARISIMNATETQTNSGDCDSDGYVEPLPARDPAGKPAPTGGGLVPENIGATTKDPWGTEYGYCAWDLGSVTVSDNNAGCGGNTARRLNADASPGKPAVAIISAGKDRKFSTTCSPAITAPADCSSFPYSVSDGTSGHCYFSSGTNLTRSQGKSYCQSNGGYMASISNTAENTLVYNFALTLPGPIDFFYLGGTDSAVEGTWVWDDGPDTGTQFSNGASSVNGRFVSWDTPEPDGGAVENAMGYTRWQPPGTWIDFPDHYAKGVICEMSPPQSTAITKASGSDDIVMQYTYNDANNLSGDELWKIRDTKPGTATIDKDLSVTGGADLLGPLNLMKSGLILPDDTATGACDATTDQQLRVNFTSNPPVLEICDFAGGNGWAAVSVGTNGNGADCSGLGDAHYNDASSGHCYYVVKTAPLTHSAAETSCEANDAYLAVISSQAENDLIVNQLSPNQLTFLGMTETVEGTYKYTYGELAGTIFWTGGPSGSASSGKYANFTSGEPDNTGGTEACVAINYWTPDKWVDYSCGIAKDYICEKSPSGAARQIVRLLTSGSGVWTVPGDVTSVDVEIIGAGGTGFVSNGGNKGAGGGGAYAAKSGITVTPGASVNFNIAAGGSGADTWFSSTGTVMAKAGTNATSTNSGTGGTAAASVGDVKYSGGNGGNATSTLGGQGAGGAAGPHGNGAAGGTTIYNGAGGGGGADGGTVGANTAGSGVSAAGGNNRLGSGGGVAGTSSSFAGNGTNGGGGGGANPNPGYENGGDGSYEVIWTDSTNNATGGPGSGGGGGNNVASSIGGDGGKYGGGAGGGRGASGAAGGGLIVLKYQSAEYTGSGGSGEEGLCAGATNPGDTCANGDVYVGTFGGIYFYTTKCDYGQTWNGSSCTGARTKLPWNNGNGTGGKYYGITSDWMGKDNTKTLVAADADISVGGIQPHQAAAACDALSANGKTDWYLPAENELSMLYLAKSAIGNFATDDYYWSSTETHDASTPLNALRQMFSDGYQYYDGDGKPQSQYVRCMRSTYLSPSPASAQAPTNGLVGYWAFNTSQTATKDSSGNNHFMSYGLGAGGGQQWEFSWLPYGAIPGGGAAIGDGSPDGISINHAADLNTTSFTLSAWIFPQTSGSDMDIINKWDNSYHTPYWLMRTSANKIECGLSLNNASNWGQALTPATIPQDAWTHVTCTYDNASRAIKIYLNGSLSVTATAPAGTPDGNTQPVWMGWLDAFSNETFIGALDEVRIYNRPLDATEVSAVYSDDGSGAINTLQPAFNPDMFITDPQVRQCTSANIGPFKLVGTSDNSNYYRSLEYYNGYLFSGGYNTGVSVFKPNGDGTVTRITTQGSSGGNTAGGVFFDGTYYYVGNGFAELTAFTFNGTTMTEVGAIDTPGYSWDIDGFGGYLFVADSEAVRAYTFDGTTFTFVAEYMTSAGDTNQLWTDGRYIYAADNGGGLVILTFDGAKFTQVAGATSPLGFINETTGDGKYIYANATGGISVYSFDGTTLKHLADYDNDGTSYMKGMFIDGANIYAGWEDGYLEALRFDGSRFISLARWPISDVLDTVRSVGDYLYVTFENSPMQIFSGFECNSGNNLAAGLGARAANPYIGKIATNYTGGCGIKPDGSVWCWGRGGDGQRGDNSTSATAVSPQRVVDSNGYVQIAGGQQFNCGIRTDGSGWCWGDDLNGRLGNGSLTGDKTTPSPISGGTPPAAGWKWTKIATGETHACGIAYTGDMYCWGRNGSGQLGIGSTGGTRTSPTLVVDSKKYTDVSVGYSASCGIDYRGALWCWGVNESGRLGSGENVLNPENTPVLIRDPGPWVKVSVGRGQICGIKSDGTLWCWGDPYDGAIGQYDPGFVYSLPVPIAEPGPWIDVSTSAKMNGTSCAVKQDGTAWCWGIEEGGAFGNDNVNTGNFFLPVRVLDPGPWATISVTGSVTCGMKTDGSAWCWGNDANGELGNGAALTGIQTKPTPVQDFPSRAPWSWNDTATATVADTAAPDPNISVSGVGYNASGRVYDCSGLGLDAYYNDPATGHCYARSSVAANWTNSQTTCAQNGGYLASVTSEAEQRAIIGGIGVAREVWIGAKDEAVEGDWYYMTGELAGTKFWSGTQTGNPQNGMYNNWETTDPNGNTTENCAAMFLSSASTWTDNNCGNAKRYLCEWGTSGNNGGLMFGPSVQKLIQYNGGSELLIDAKATTTSAQISWKAATAASVRSMGIDYISGAFEFGKNVSNVTDWMHAITPQMQIDSAGRVGIGTTTSYTALEINGGLRVGNDTGACTVQRAGVLRYNGTIYQYCNGSAWTTF